VHLIGVRRIFAVNVLAHVDANPRGAALDAGARPGPPDDGRRRGRPAHDPRRRPYTVTKHGAVAFAVWLAVTYGDRGIGASVVRRDLR
jgi:NAD(P)-dependent dehydrogenase (short-subunit alcohol dehydrogenase family)